jgi:CheY-like chemotaxis protein
LALARSLISLHGGEIKALSAGPGQGSEFAVHLPLAAAPGQGAIDAVGVPSAQASRRVLVVDDNVDAATSLGALLESHGHSVRTCFDGSSAFEAATQLTPDVAFIDLNMPHPDGIELAKMIRRQSWGMAVRLVALTGMGQPGDLARTREAGFDEHLTKPASPAALFKSLVTPRYAASNVVAFRPGNAGAD